MTVNDILSQIEIVDGKVRSKTSGKVYEIQEFLSSIESKCKLSKKDLKELETYFISYLKPQSEKSKYIEEFIDKYKLKFSDGVYMIGDAVVTMEYIYRFMWKNEKLLPSEVTYIMEDVEKISEPMDLQGKIYQKMILKAKSTKKEKSEYLENLYSIYPDIKWRELFYNILVPNTKPLFHIFYDDGVGGTGKSTLLEVLTKIVGEEYTSNVLLDQFGNRFIFANMLGKYLNIGDDNGKNDELQNIGTLKSIITGNRVTIDRKNISPIEVRIFAKQLFATNILPYIDFTDGGIMRRLNIVLMNKIIPKNVKLPTIDDEEIGAIIKEVLKSEDLEENSNSLAITSSPLFMFFDEELNPTYLNYTKFCDTYGFKRMNVINFNVKSKFIKSYKGILTMKEIKEDIEDIPF